jgi:hypothetical protein
MEKKINEIIKVFFEPYGINDNITLLRTKLYCMEFTRNHNSVDIVKNSFGHRICRDHLPKEVLSDEYIDKIIKHI